VLFGGDGPTFFTDTWEWDGTRWLERNVAGPPPRYDHAMAGLGGKVILFGGQGESGTLGDTWQWDGTSWTQLNVPGPTPRFGHQMTTLGNKIVLFGGTTATTGDVCDTWEFDGTSWTATGASLTTGLHCVGHSIAALNGLVYLFGGIGAESDTWAYDGTSWKQVASTGPVGRAWAAMATTQWCCTEQPPPPSVILFGGQVNANDILSDTWQWDGTKWTQLVASGLANQPPPRWDPGIAMFQGPPGQGGLVLFGGAQAVPPGGWLGDTWVLQTPGGLWTQANVPSPPARQVYTMAGR
jgi:N-acetylneuraminic acid mutarotase